MASSDTNTEGLNRTGARDHVKIKQFKLSAAHAACYRFVEALDPRKVTGTAHHVANGKPNARGGRQDAVEMIQG